MVMPLQEIGGLPPGITRLHHVSLLSLSEEKDSTLNGIWPERVIKKKVDTPLLPKGAQRRCKEEEARVSGRVCEGW